MKAGRLARILAGGGWLYPPLVLYVVAVSVIPIAFLLGSAFSMNTGLSTFEGPFGVDNFSEFFADDFYMGRLLYTLAVALGVTAVTVALAVPLTFLITSMASPWRTVWLVFLFASLALSEVLAVYAWQLLLSKSSGLPGWLEALGLVENARSWWPGFIPMLVVLVYYTLPVAVIILFPAIARLDPSRREAARTMGFKWPAIFLSVTLPSIRAPVMRTAMLCFLLNIGGFVVSQQLGRPEDWMFSVFIADFMRSFNVPLAVTLSLFLLLVAVAALAVMALIGREREPA